MTRATTAFTIPEEMIEGLALLGYTRKKSRSQLVVEALQATYGEEMTDLSARFAALSVPQKGQSEQTQSKKASKK